MKIRSSREKMIRFATLALCACFLSALVSCAKKKPAEEIMKSLPVESLDGVISRDGVTLDKSVTADGNGALKITAVKPGEFHLFDIEGRVPDNSRLIYRAKVRCENIKGKAYLMMWVRIPGKGEFFSKALTSPLTGNMEWTSMETPFLLQRGQSPDLVRLNLFVEGSGTVWLDDVKLIKSPL